MGRFLYFNALLALIAMIASCTATSKSNEEDGEKDFGEIAWEKSAIPVRPGKSETDSFWNKFSERFIYAPAFDFKEIDGAEKYRFEVLSLADSKRRTFEDETPFAPLTPVWTDMPVGSYRLKVIGVSEEGKDLEVSGTREFYRAAPFDGIYHAPPEMPYDKSAMTALETLLERDFVQYWLKHEEPDPSYGWYRYPSKIYSALVVGAVTQARLKEGTEAAEEATKLAQIVADELIEISFEEGTPYEYFPPTYHGYPDYFEPGESHMNYDRSMTIQGADAGHAYLDLYDMTGEDKYLEAAKRIAQTYLQTQLDNGSWYLYVNNKTGEKIEDNVAIPTSTINFFNRLRKDYDVEGLEEATERALAYVMENPVKTFNWQGQFEDISARQPYENQSREQACDLAIYLFQNKPDDPESVKLAEDLIRFSEDQFVIWERPKPVINPDRNPGALPQNWITPSVQEQYAYWRPISRAAGIMIDTYWEAYKATGKEMYLAKAKSIANTFPEVQQYHDGNYVTHFTRHKMNFWLNNAVYPAKVLMIFHKNLESLEEGSL